MFRKFATVICRDIRKGSILKREGKYLEIMLSHYIQRGSEKGMHIEFMDFHTHKRGKLFLDSAETAEIVNLVTYPVEVESVDLDKGFLKISDIHSNIVDIPLEFASWAKNGVKPGTLLQLITDDEIFVKLTLPLDLKVARK